MSVNFHPDFYLVIGLCQNEPHIPLYMALPFGFPVLSKCQGFLI